MGSTDVRQPSATSAAAKRPGFEETRSGMRILWDVPIEMDDGLVVRADVFLPMAECKYPVLLTYGPYAKGLAFQDGYPSAWTRWPRSIRM